MDGIVKWLLFAIGILEALLACCLIGCGIANIIFGSRLYPIGHAIWTGAFFLVTAIFAIVAATGGRRAVYVIHVFTAILSIFCIIPCLIGLLVIEMISDSWYHFWSDSNWCQGGCYTNGDYYVRVNYGSLWTSVYRNEQYTQCNDPSWNSNCHPNTSAVDCEIVAITAAAILAFLFLVSVMLSGFYIKYITGSDSIHPETSKAPNSDRYAPQTVQYPFIQNLYTSWNIPQYNTVRFPPMEKNTPVYAASSKQDGRKISPNPKTNK